MANQGRITFGIGFNVDQSGLNQLKASLASLQNMQTRDLVNVDSKGKAQAKLREIKEMAGQVEAALQQSFNPALNTYNIDTFKKKLNENVGTLSQVKAKMAEAGAEGTIAFRNLATAISSTKLPLRESHDLLKAMGTTLMNTVKWSIASNAINTVTGSVQKAWSYTKQLDESLNNIMIVTDKSADSMAQFARQANKAAKELGKSTRDYTDASLIYYQQGLDDAQVKSRTETTLKAANVTGQSADVVSEQLTAVWNGYKVQAQEAELYVDKLAAVAATTAADLEELSTGMSKVASAANTMGVDIDQLNAMLATAVSVTRQAPESVGTAFKTVFARIGDIEAGISDEATLGEYTKQMQSMGINVLDTNGKLRDQGDVIEEIGNKWNQMSREQQIALSQTMAGTRQYNNLLALFDNWNMYEQAMKTSVNAAGTLQKQQDTYMESIEAHMEQLRTAGERVYQALLDPDSANDLLDVLTEIVDKFGSFIESIGGGGNLLMSLIPILTRVFSGSIATGLTTFVTNLKNAGQEATTLKSVLQGINEIGSLDSLTEADKKINDLRRTLVLLRQQGVITIEEFNSMSASVTEYGDAISEIERKKENREKTKDRLGVLTDAGLAEKGNHNIAKDKAKREKYFDRVYTFGDELSSKGLSEEAIKSSIGDKNAALAKSGAANAYKEINDALISIKNNIDDIDNKNKEFTKGIQTTIANQEKYSRTIIDSKRQFEKLVEKTESLKTFYTDTTEGKKFENYEARISKLLSKEHLDSEEMAILQKLQNEYSSFINSHLQEVSSLGSKEELESIDIKIKELTASSNKFKQSIEDINKAHSNQEDQIEKIKSKFEELDKEAKKLEDANLLGGASRGDLTKRANSIRNLLDDTSKRGELLKDPEKLSHLYEEYEATLQKAIAEGRKEVKNLSTDIDKGITDGVGKAKAQAEGLGEALRNALSKAQLELKIKQFVNLTSNIAMAGNALRNLINLGDIWNNQDLELGEKIFQTITNVGSSLSMLLPTITMITAAISKKTAATTASTGATAASAITDMFYAKTQDEVTEEMTDQAFWLKSLKSLQNDLNDEQRKAIANTLKEAAARKKNNEELAKEALLKDTEQNINDNKKSFNLFKSKKAPTTAAGKVLNVGGGALAAAAAAYIGATLTSKLVTSLYDQQEANFKAASEAAKQAESNLNKVTEAYDNLSNSLSNISSLKDSLKDLTEGSVEWEKAVADINAETRQLIETYPEIAKNGYYENGVLTLDSESQLKVERELLNQRYKAQNSKIVADETKQAAEIAAKQESLAGELNYLNELSELGTGATVAISLALGGIFGLATGGLAVPIIAGLGLGAFGGGFSTYLEEEEENDTEEALIKVVNKLAESEEKDLNGYLQNSSKHLAELLDKNVEELTNAERALLSNTSEINALAQEIRKANELKLMQDTEFYRQRYLSQGYSVEDAAAMGGMTASATDYAAEEEAISKRAEQIMKKKGNNKDLIIQWAESQGITLTKDDIKETGGANFKYKNANGEWVSMSYETIARQQATTEVKNTASSEVNALEYKKQLNAIVKGISLEGTDILKSLLASNKEILAENIEEFNNATIDELQKIWERADELNLSSEAKKALGKTIEEAKIYQENIATVENWGESTYDAINKIFNDNGEWSNIWNNFSASQIRAFGKALTKIELFGGKQAAKAAESIFSKMTDADAESVLTNMNWESETLLADFSAEMEKVGKVLDYTSGEGFAIAYALSRANDQMVISKEAWKETASILESLNEEQASLDMDNYQHLIEMYGTAISKYFTQMEDGTYRLITASTDFAKTIDDLEERKIEAAIKTEIESIRTFDEEYDKILNDFVFNTIPDSDDGISASKIKTLDEIIKVKGYENASLTGKDLNKTEGFSESQTHAVLQGALTLDEYKGLNKVIDFVYTKTYGDNWRDNGDAWNDMTEQVGGKNFIIDLDPAGDSTSFTYDELQQEFTEEEIKKWFKNTTSSGGYYANNVEANYAQLTNAIANQAAKERNEALGVDNKYVKKSDIAQWLYQLSAIGALNSELYTKYSQELDGLPPESESLKVPEDGGDCAFVADVKKDLESSDVKPDTEKLNEYIDQWIRSADSQEEFDERVAEAQGLASTVLGDEFDEKAFKDTVKELQISLGVKLETKALENFKTEMDQISNLISNLDSKLSHLSSVADSLYGQDRLDYIEEQNKVIQQQIKLLERQAKIEQLELNRQRTFTPGENNTTYEAALKDLARLAGYANADIMSEAELWNALGITDVTTQEGAQNSLLNIREMFAQRGIAADENLNKLYLAAIGNLETILEPVTSGKTKYAIDEKKAQELANNLVSFEHKIEFTLDEGELKREFEALKREVFIDEEDFSEITKSYITDYQTAISDLTTIEDALKEIDSLNISAEAKLEKRKELTSQYGEKLKEIQQIEESIDQQRLAALNKISEGYEKQISYLEEINGLLDTQRSMIELIYGEDAYEMLNSYYSSSLDNALAIQESTQQRFAAAASNYSRINDTTMSDEEREAIIEEYTAAGQASAEAMYSVMEARRDKYLNDTEIAIKNFNKSVYGSLDTELFTSEWDWTKSQMDKYYDSVQSLFEKDKLAVQFDTAANEATSLRAQEQINKLKREELAQLEEIEKLSEYDVQHAQKKLDILQAEIALREAQENKTQMRLMRGADGSYSYQYVADQAAIVEAQNKLTEAQDALYNMELDEYTSSIDEFQGAMQDLADVIRKFGEDGIYTTEELALIEKRKKEIQNLAERSIRIRTNVFESAELAASTFGKDLSELTQGTVLQMTKDIDAIINEVAKNGIDNSYQSLMDTMLTISNKYLDKQKTGAEELATVIGSADPSSGLIGSYQTLSEKQDAVIKQYQTEYSEVSILAGQYDILKASLERVRDMYIAIANARKLSNKEEEEEISGPGPDNTRTGGLRKTNKTSSEVASLFNQEVYLYSERSRFDEEGNRVASWRTGNIHTYNSSGELDIITVSDHTGKDMKNTKYTVISSDIWTDAEGWGYVQVRDKDGEIFYLPIEFLKNENKNSENGHWAVLNSGLFDGLEKYDTGGYTGEWGTDGRMAMLHEKELVLNKKDTENFLDALSILRELNLSMMAQIGRFGMPFSNSQNSILQQLASQPIEQNVTIQAEFPNATDKDEIKEAFNDLINLATQYVHQDDKF